MSVYGRALLTLPGRPPLFGRRSHPREWGHARAGERDLVPRLAEGERGRALSAAGSSHRRQRNARAKARLHDSGCVSASPYPFHS